MGREVKVGDAITFAPGNKPIRFARIDDERHTHPTLNMTYRLAFDLADVGYVLFDDQPVWDGGCQ